MSYRELWSPYPGSHPYGRGGWSWYTGSAAWMHRAAVESMFGLDQCAELIVLTPCLPSHWERAELRLRRGDRRLRFIFVRADTAEVDALLARHAATLLREHRGDGHNAALVAHGIGGSEAHVLLALSFGMRAEEFDRTQHLPEAQLAAVVDRLRGRGLVDADGRLPDAGRQIRERIEALTDELAAPAYDVLSADEFDELVARLEPIAAAV